MKYKIILLFLIFMSPLMVQGAIYDDCSIYGICHSKNIDELNKVTQYHRINNATVDSINTWYNITWDMIVDGETTSGYILEDSNQTIRIIDKGIYRVQGCIHPYNDNAGIQESAIYLRVLIDGDEARCLQSSFSKSFRGGGIDVSHYIGTVNANQNSKIQVQWRTTNTNLILKGSSVFDNPVASSVNLEKIGYFN